jgi:hypothetical protein
MLRPNRRRKVYSARRMGGICIAALRPEAVLLREEKAERPCSVGVEDP